MLCLDAPSANPPNAVGFPSAACRDDGGIAIPRENHFLIATR